MNASLWQLAGWTMIHSLWLGAAVALAGGFLRLACRRAAPNTRYAISLATLALLALTPLATAAWLSVIGVPQLAANLEFPLLPLPLGEGWGEGQNPLSTTPPANATVENPSPGPSLQGRGIEGTPGRMPGLSGQAIDLAQATPAELKAIATQHQPAQALPTNSQPTFPLPPSALSLSSTSAQSLVTSHLLNLLPTLWLIGAPLTFTLLATGLLGSARLRRRATPLAAGPAFDACERLRQTLNITRRVALAVSDGVAQPILVGVFRPLILLPTAAMAGWTPEQLDMVLLHELAHVRRWDNLVNLLQRIVESLLFFHPAVWLLSRQVRRDREECCDAAVIAHTDRPHQYAELLVSIASALRGGPAPSLAVASAMASHPLAGRIRRILNFEEEPMRITRRTLAATLLLPLLLAGAIFYSAAGAQDPPPSKGGARGGITDAKRSSAFTSPDQPQADSPSQATEGGAQDALTGSPSPDNAADLRNEISRLQALVTERQKEVAVLTIFDEFSRIVSLNEAHFEHIIRNASSLDPSVESAHRQLNSINQELAKLAEPTVAIDETDVRRLQRRRAETAQQLEEARQRFIKDQHALLNKIPKEELGEEITKRIRRLGEASKELATHQLDLALAKKLYKARQEAGGRDSTNPNRESTGSNNDEAPSAAPFQELKPSAEISTLQKEIRKLERLIVKTKKEIVDVEVAKELAIQNASNPAMLEAAVNAELEKDPTFNMYQSQLVELQVALQGRIASKNPNIPVLNRISANIQKTEAELAKYRSEAERAVREKAAKTPNNALRAVIVEYKMRRAAADVNLAEYQQQLIYYKQKLAAANAQLGVPPAIGTYASPTIAAAEAAQRLKTDEGETAKPNALEAFDNAKSAEERQAAFKQFAEIFKPSGANPPVTVTYPVPAGDNMRERIEGIFAGFEMDPYGPKITESVRRWSPDNRSVKIAAPHLAHEQYLSYLFAEIAAKAGEPPAPDESVMAAGGPGSSNHGAATAGSNASNAQPGALDPFGSAARRKEAASLSSFPTLEHQKIADRAYKLLGLELEPATGEDLQRIKKLGYSGGLRVVAVDPDKQRRFISGNFLVGLHVWPTPDLQALDAILTRDDLDELSPLKFRGVAETPTDETKDSNKPVMEDRLITGRMPIDLEAFRSIRRTLPPNQSNAVNSSPSSRATEDDVDSISVIQPPTSIATGLFGGGTKTTAYVKVPSNREFNPAQRLTTAEFMRYNAAKITLLQSKSLLTQVLSSKTVAKLPTVKNQKDAVAWLQQRLRAHFPGDGEILELCLEDGVAAEDEAILQAVIDHFIEAMKDLTDSPADPNAAPHSSTDAPGDLSRYVAGADAGAPGSPNQGGAATGSNANDAQPTANASPGSAAPVQEPELPSPARTPLAIGDVVLVRVAGALPEQPIDNAYNVDDLGTIALGPTYGRVPVVGLTILEAEKAIQEKLQTIVQNPQVQLSRLSKPETTSPSSGEPTFLYDGKTFDEWRDLWKLELNPERRTEAISALAAFGRTGRGDEAISAILDVAADYDFDRIDDTKPEGKLKLRVIEALAPEDMANAEDQWLPLLLDRLKSGPQKWDPLLIQLLARTGPPYRESFALTPENLGLLKQAAADPAYGPNARLVNHLYWSAPEDEEVAQLVKATLAGADAANAVELLRNIGYRRIEEYPEKLDLLFHPDPAIRRSARTALNHSLDPGTHDAVAAKLLAIVADPKQADRHADAIRAIAAIVKRVAEMPKTLSPTLSQKTIQAIADGLTPILAEGSAELIPPAYLVADKVRRTANFKNKLTDFLSNPPEERKAPVEAALKASQDEEATLIDQPEHSGNMDGKGGGFF